MWKKRNLLLVVFAFAISFSGCGKKEADNQQKFQSDYMELSPAGVKIEEGYFCVIQGVSYFVDFETKTAVPICNKPDCRHLSEYEDRGTTCNAVNRNYDTFPYQGKMYGINAGEHGSELTVSELDGSNLKVKGEFETGDSIMDEGVIVGNQMFYSYKETLDIAGTGETMIPEYGCCFAVLNLDTMQCEKIFSKEDGVRMNLLGGTKEYQIYSLVKDDNAVYYQFDYATLSSEEIPLIGGGFGNLCINEDGKSFYYTGGEKPENGYYEKNVFLYDMEKKENKVCVSREEIETALGEDCMLIYLLGVKDGNIMFLARTNNLENRMFVKEKESSKLRELSLPNKLPIEEAFFNSVLQVTEDGMYFSYMKYLSDNGSGDSVDWYAYISWKDLLEDKNVVKEVLNPRISSLCVPVDKKGNVISTDGR